MKLLRTVGSSAPDTGVARICAKVKTMCPHAPNTHKDAESVKYRRSFSPDSESLPSSSRSKKAMASNEPIVAKAPRSDRNLKLTANKFIVQRIICVRIVTIQQLRRLPELVARLQKHLFPNCYWQVSVAQMAEV